MSIDTQRSDPERSDPQRSGPGLAAGGTSAGATPAAPDQLESPVKNPSPRSSRLPRWATWVILVAAAVLIAAYQAVSGRNLALFVVGTAVLFVVGTYVAARIVEGARRALDRFVTLAVAGAFAVAMVPLVSLVWTVVERGSTRFFDPVFYTSSMRGVVGAGGGIYHSLLGTLIMTGIATVMSVPVGLLTAIYLVEYGRGRLARAITFFVDVMTGIPSIVAGLFAFALFVIFFGPGVRMGFAGSVALSVLMIPVVVRSTEEMLRVVPNRLREAAFALGVPRWRTIVKVVVPTAISGIASGVTLAIARIMGETAPLLVTAGTTASTNRDPFADRMDSLPVFSYYQYLHPGVPPQPYYDRAWAAAMLLVVIVMVLNLLARIVARIFAPKFS